MIFNVENNNTGFLGKFIERNKKDQKITLMQSRRIDKFIEALGLEDVSAMELPSKVTPLGKDLFGKEVNAVFNYLSVIGMMLYLSSHSCPDTQFAVSQCTQFSSNPKASHKAALKRIGRYLKGMQGKGLVIRGAYNGFNVGYHMDADFAGLWASEPPDDQDCAQSKI
eukprot:15098801-Ditylum_brightwellii.AAC.1